MRTRRAPLPCCYTQPVTRLIVNADDFGLTAGVNRAIAELHAGGVLTSTTLMAIAGATRDAIEKAKAAPALGVGCHIVLVDGESTLPPRQIPSLIDNRTGKFLPTLGGFLARLFTGRIRGAEIEAEARAQIERLQAKGLRLTHVDTHKHTHMFPAVLRAVLRAAQSCNVEAIRNPFEPVWAIEATPRARLMRMAEVRLLRRLEPICRRIIAEMEFATTEGTVAMVGTGTLDTDTLRALLHKMPAGTFELVTHPGYNDADLDRVRTRLRASRDTEREALRVLKEFAEIELISFAELGR